jgi:O-antigen/teichoic acid export membrane protein
LKLVIVYLLVVGNWDKLILYAVLLLSVAFIIAGIYRQYCLKRFNECRYQFEWNKKVIYPMLTFSGWDLIGNGAFIGANEGVNQLLNLFFGTLLNAAYGVSSTVKNATLSFVRSFQMAVNPQIVKLYAAGKIRELHDLIFENAKFSFSLTWLLLLPIALHLEPLLQIWLVEIPEYTPLVCRLVLAQAIIACVQRPFVMAIHATGRMKVFQLSAGTVVLSVLPVSYFFLKAGAAPHIPFIVYICGTTVELLVEVFLLRRWIKLSTRTLFKTVLIPISIIIACTLPASFLVHQYLLSLFAVSSSSSVFVTEYLPLLLSLAFTGLAVCISVYYIALNKATRATIIEKVKDFF